MKIIILTFFTFILSTTDLSAQGSWSITDSLIYPRLNHASVSLANGNILVTGGEEAENKCEIYDYKLKKWIETTPMLKSRLHHKLVYLEDNGLLVDRVLAVGGYKEKSCEIYNIETGRWSFADTLNSRRMFGQTVTLLKNGTVLIAGGFDVNDSIHESFQLNECQIYYPNDDKWILADLLKIGRRDHTATLLNDGNVLVTGGFNSSSCEIFNTSTLKWKVVHSMSQNRYSHSAILLNSGKILVSGGIGSDGVPLSTCELYDPSTDNWQDVNPMSIPRSYHKSIKLNDSLVLFFGGEWGDEWWEIYNVSTFSSIFVDEFPFNKNIQTAHLLPDSTVISIGGLSWIDGSTPFLYTDSQCEIFSQNITDILDRETNSPTGTYLYQNYPNPFNRSSEISFALPEASKVVLEVYNTTGQKVAVLINGAINQGYHSVIFDGSSLASGIYIYKAIFKGLSSGKTFSDTKRMLLIK